MIVIAKVQNGVLALPPGTQLPEGAEVRVIVPDPKEAPAPEVPESEDSFSQWMLKYAGTIDGLPEDFADEHDHYIHGTPRRKKAK